MRIVLAMTAAFLLLAACDDSDDATNDLASVSGTLELTGAWPTEGDIQISLFAHWNTDVSMSLAPGGPPEFHTDDLFSPTPAAMTHSIPWTIEDVNPGSYPSLVVGWRNGGTMGLDEPVVGMYGANFAIGDTLPAEIVVAAGQDLVLDFSGDLGIIPVPEQEVYTALLSGEVVFPGDWPSGYGSGIYVLLMSSSDPGLPSMPQAMQIVTQDDPTFSLSVDTDAPNYSAFLTVYGYPYDFTDPAADFYGGYGWDWSAGGTATLAPTTCSQQNPAMTELQLDCRAQE